MEEMPSLNTPVQRIKVAILSLDLTCCVPVTHSGGNSNHWQVSRKEAGQIFFKQTWTVKARDARRITAAELKYMRTTAGYTWTD